MKHLFTLLALIASMTAGAQTPYNPDSDGDNMIGINDVLDFLPYFGMPFFPAGDTIVTENIFVPDAIHPTVQEETDVVYISAYGSGSDQWITLPEGNTWKMLLLMGTANGNYNVKGYDDGPFIGYNVLGVQMTICVRGNDGIWRGIDQTL